MPRKATVGVVARYAELSPGGFAGALPFDSRALAAKTRASLRSSIKPTCFSDICSVQTRQGDEEGLSENTQVV